MLAGCTSAIDSHYGVMAAMGERFLLYRLPDDADEATAERALENQWREEEMRADLMGAVEALLACIQVPGSPADLPGPDGGRAQAGGGAGAGDGPLPVGRGTGPADAGVGVRPHP